MKKNIITIITIVCSLAPNLISNAAVITDQTIDTASTATATVQVTGKESSFEVVLPKSITAAAADGDLSVSYKVKVTGDIAGAEYVEVQPDATFTLSQANKSNIIAQVTQSKNAFRDASYSEVLTATEMKMGSDISGTITASGLTAGDWTGTLKFSIALKKTT